ncbi:hypothetical protein [Flavobacterium sp.]|uniref:hypothetical protein n=1 Tax=Flavobacterium sp. TaxID=239 RepID=UPI0039E34208
MKLSRIINPSYPKKVYLSTIAGGAILMLILLAKEARHCSELLPFFGLGLAIALVSFVLAIPTMFLFWQFHHWMIKTNMFFWKAKILLSVFSMACIGITFFAIDPHYFTTDYIKWPMVYMIAMCTSVWIFRIQYDGMSPNPRPTDL